MLILPDAVVSIRTFPYRYQNTGLMSRKFNVICRSLGVQSKYDGHRVTARSAKLLALEILRLQHRGFV